MSTSRQTDTTLIIRARDEASKAVSAIEGALEQLLGTQRKVASGSESAATGFQQIVGVLAQLDRAYAKTAAASDQGASALDRQAAAVAANKAAYAALEQQQRGAARAADQLRVALVEAVRTGGDPAPIRARIAEVTAEMSRLGGEARKLDRVIQTQESGFARSASSLAELERQTRLAGSVSTFAAQQADEYTRALERQAAAAATARNIDRLTDRRTGKSAADSASAFQSLGPTSFERQIAEAEKVRASLDPVGAAAQNAAAEIGRLRALNEAGVLSANDLAAAEARVAESLRRITGELDGTTAAEKQHLAAVRALREELNPLEAAQAKVFAEQQRYREALDAGRISATEYAAKQRLLQESFARTAQSLDTTAAAEKADAAAVRALREELNPLQAAQSRVFAEQQRYRALLEAGKITVAEYAGKQKLLQEQFTRTANALAQGSANKAPGLFGLKPYELQNLGYQVNDVATQLASGTSLTQTLAQQGGQILQLFPKVGSAIFAALGNPVILGFVATVGAIAVGLSRAAEEAGRLRDITANLSLSADSGVYDPETVEASARSLRNYGASIEDATAAGKIFTKEGVNPERLDEFGRAAQDLADVTGVKLPEAARKLADGFTGGYESILKLDREYDFLSAAQDESIRQAFQDGDAQRARAIAFDAFTAKVREAAEEQRGNATEASRALKRAYNDLLDGLANTTPIQGAISLFGQLGAAITRATGNATAFTSVADDVRRLAEANKNLDSLIARDNFLGGRDPLTRSAIQRQQSEIAQLQARIKAQQTKAEGDTNARREQEGKKETARLKEQIEARRTIKSLADAENTARREATEFVNQNFALADAATQQAYIQLKVDEARRVVQKRLADEAKRAADERERERKEQERLAKQTVFRAPVDGRVSSGFGKRAAPKEGASTFHQGIDYAVPIGTAVRAPANGVVIETGTDAKLGKFVYIDHGKGTISKFGHLSDNTVVRPGQNVAAGDVIAKSGNTGNSTGAHLHYSVLVNGKPVDPTRGLFPADGKARFQIDEADAVGDFEAAQDKLAEKRQAYLEKVDASNVALQEDTRQLEEQANLTGRALLAKQREAAIEDAIRKAKADAKTAGVADDSPELALRLAKLKEVTGAYFDASRAKDAFDADRAAVDKPVSDLTEQRDALRDQVAFLRDAGLGAEASDLLPVLGQVNGQLQLAIDKAIAFYRALKPGDNPLGLTAAQLDAIIIKLAVVKASSKEWGTILGVSAQQIAQQFASTLVNSIDGFIQALVDGENAFDSLKDAFLDFAGNFLRLIAQMILQQIAFNIAKAVLSAVGVPVGLNHTGGAVGSSRSGTRTISPMVFEGATRMHTGGIAGLRPDEVPIIAQRGEEVITRGDPRHRANGGLGGGGDTPVNLKVVNAIDAGDFVSKGLNTTAGEKAFFNFVRSNRRALKGALEN